MVFFLNSFSNKSGVARASPDLKTQQKLIFYPFGIIFFATDLKDSK